MGRPRVWLCGAFALELSRPLVMGIVNVTPDSFSDGGTHSRPGSAIAAAVAMLDDGADIIDVGGESTRPGADPVSTDEEIARIVPVVSALAARGACVSVDTRHAAVAVAALAAGASILNDVSGFREPEMVRLAADRRAGLVVMHMLGEPRTMQAAPVYDDVVGDVTAYLGGQARMLETAGVGRERIALDPGLGFGKTTAHNIALLRGLDRLVSLGYPVLVGASRKRFIGEITGVDVPADRVGGSVAVALDSVARGAAVIRVHDVAATVQALAMRAAIEGEEGAR